MKLMMASFKGKPTIGFPIFVLMLCMLCSSAWSQETEIGFGIGGFKYSGDLSRGINLKSITPAGTVFFRNNLSNAVSFRVGLTAGQMAASDDKTPIDPFAQQRDASFDIFVFEASTVFEYHFLKWRQEHTLIRWTPYLFGGLAIFGLSGEGDKPAEYSNIQPAIPFGLGIKYILNPKWYMGVEFGARKIFFDYLDNVSEGDGTIKNFDYGNRFDNDSYYYFGVSMTYSFYTIPCPNSPYKRNYRSR
ncbi:outer membrane beta-barrel protein [Fulvivirga sp. M361]|uniref:type IX secretion system protein PorG n=1 Tax=Fulvivirga sp. M361 TaxID=2594266 RepID=UPI00117AB310|nr:DUF6089 family protein [Fulvivirga sp. M361]TRX50436.1 outer membrane beta-barrel protein [Fulvivirga sp. M361]